MTHDFNHSSIFFGLYVWFLRFQGICKDEKEHEHLIGIFFFYFQKANLAQDANEYRVRDEHITLNLHEDRGHEFEFISFLIYPFIKGIIFFLGLYDWYFWVSLILTWGLFYVFQFLVSWRVFDELSVADKLQAVTNNSPRVFKKVTEFVIFNYDSKILHNPKRIP